MKRYFILAVILVFGVVWMQAQNVNTRKSVLIGPDDTVTLQVLNSEELSKPWRVSATGDISLPLAGRVHAAGLTVEELEVQVTEQLKRYLVNPQVTAFISEFRSQPVVVTGAVVTPGTLQLEGTKTLFDMLSRAGGPKEATGKLTLRRDMAFGPIPHPNAKTEDQGTFSIVELDIQDVMSGHGAGASIQIRPLDVITVSQLKEPNLVFISGEVVKPGAVELVAKDKIPLTTLVAMSGGLSRTASAHNTMISRQSVNGTQQLLTSRIDLNRVLSGKEPDIYLHPGDIVTVPSNKVREFVQAVTMSAATASVYLIGRF